MKTQKEQDDNEQGIKEDRWGFNSNWRCQKRLTWKRSHLPRVFINEFTGGSAGGKSLSSRQKHGQPSGSLEAGGAVEEHWRQG